MSWDKDFITLMELSDRLERNETALTPEELNGKYKKSYESLKSKIKKTASDALMGYVFSGMLIQQQDRDIIRSVYEDWARIYEKEKANGLSKKLSQILFAHHDLDWFANEAMRLNCMLLYSGTYARYWCGHCSLVQGRYYSDLLDMFWTGSLWVTEDGQTYRISLPPTEEACAAEFNSEMATFRSWESERMKSLAAA